MKPQAYEALQKAKALFRHPAEVRNDEKDEIPESITQAPEPIRKPRVVLLPPNAPKFDAQTLKEEHKKMEQQQKDLTQALKKQEQIDKYVEMSTTQACAECIKMGITKPKEISKLTGKDVKQIYTAMWHLRKGDKKKYKAVKKLIPAPYAGKGQPQPTQQVKVKDDEFDREPTAYEDRNYVVLRTREDYEEKIDALCVQRNKLEDENKELKTIIKYLEGRTK